MMHIPYFSHLKQRIIWLLTTCLILCTILTGCQTKPDNQSASPDSASFDQYTDQLFRSEVCASTIHLHYTLAYPERHGITEYPRSLGHIPLPEQDTSQAACENILYTLDQFSSEKLAIHQQVTCDVIRDTMKTQLKEKEFPYYPELLSPSGGIQSELPILLAEYRFYTEKDVTDYLTLLSMLPDYFQEVIQYETKKSQAGLFMSDTAADTVIAQCKAMTANPENHFLIQTFEHRLKKLALSGKQYAAYMEQNKKILTQQVFPAFIQLAGALLELEGTGKNDGGLCHFPQGKDYYTFLTAASTGSGKNPAQQQKAIEKQRARDLTRMQLLTEQYPTLNDSCKQIILSQNTPEQMLTCLSQQIQEDFPPLQNAVTSSIRTVDPSLREYLAPAFYLTVPLDASKENAIYINQQAKTDDLTLFTTLAHEGYPGHLYQTVYFNEQHTSPLRHLFNYSGYVEGWATYAELYSYRYLGLPKHTAEYLMLEQSVILSLYASADIGIHYEGWNLAKTSAFFQTYGITDTQAVKDIYEYIIATPANYLKYYCGFLEILELRNFMQQKSGDAFRITAFHEALLSIGPAPFSVIKQYLPAYYQAACKNQKR